MMRNGMGAESLAWTVMFVLMPLTCVYYPVSVLPAWLQWISWLLPPTYVFEGMRSVVAGQGLPWDRLAIGGALALVYLVLACLFFFSVYRSVIRNGLIARYSAETVT